VTAVTWLFGGVKPFGAAGELTFTASSTVVMLAAIGSVAIVALAWGFAPRRRGRMFQALLLVPVLVAVVVMLAGPTWVERQGYTVPGRFVILVDDSLSMNVREASTTGGSTPRSTAVPGILQAIGHPDADRFLFGSDLSQGAVPTYREAGTDLGAALRAVSDRYAGEHLTGIAVITDGIDRGSLRRDWQAGQGVSLGKLPLPGPLTLYGTGAASSLFDLALANATTGGFAFIRAPFRIGADIVGRGFEGRHVTVSLLRDGSPEGHKDVTLDGNGRGNVFFEVTPTRVGRVTYTLSVPVSSDDAVPANNTLDTVVRIVRDRMRVLQICGSPAADEKFMRQFLKQDPAVDLVSFFILRTDADMRAGYSDEELSLIPFPYERLFSSDLQTFDLVIFQNFDYAPYFRRDKDELLTNVANYVSRGGAFAMIGGDRSFDLGKYAGTPIERILPVRLGVGGDPVDLARFQPVLTEAGRGHPVTALAVNPAQSEATWKQLAPLEGLNLSLGASDGAAVLLEHPTRKTPSGSPLPVVAVREVEQGRSLAFMGDSSWRWSFGEAAAGRTNQAYLRFWKNAMRWLVGDWDSQRLVVDTGQENYGIGDEVRVVTRVRDVGFRPQGGVLVTGRVEGPSIGASGPVETSSAVEGPERAAPASRRPETDAGGSLDLATGSFEGTTSPDGELFVTFKATMPGAHRVKVKALLHGDAQPSQAETVFAVSAREAELDEIVPDPSFLDALASAAGGRHDRAGAARAPLEDPEAGRHVEETRQTPLFHAPILPLIAGIFGTLSWWVRRRIGGR
jgi:uncharacterized membrane protein